MNLVIIEGPGKRDTLKKYLGAGYEVVATKGHIRDLPIKSLAIDINNNFEPKYEPMPDKKDIIDELKKKMAKASRVFIATDPDREGEAIAWHVEHILGIKESEPCRIEFNEISKNAVNKALEKPRPVNLDLVNAQQGRRVLDRLVGYKVSPVICKKIQKNLSAGRVQSVALKIIVDREKEIKAFKPEEFWNIGAILSKAGSNQFKAALSTYKGKKYQSKTAKETGDVVGYLKAQQYVVSVVKKSVTTSHAPPPFITSTMQQDALNKLGMSIKRTSMSAQQLYEGVEIKDEGKTALITYIRTDSTRVSPEAQEIARQYIANKFGADYVPKTPNYYKSKKSAQDAHEAIRPINIELNPEKIKSSLTPDNYKLYKIIYDRFLASQMAEATYNSLAVTIDAGDYGLKLNGRTPLFAGFTAAYTVYNDKDKEVKDDEKEVEEQLPELNEGETLKLHDITKEQKFTKPPPRYTEASLVKVMEDKGIGRPATYAPTIATLAYRHYTEKEGRNLIPTDLGITVVEYLEKYFTDFMNITFTAEMEDKLDDVEDGLTRWQDIVGNFYDGLEDKIHFAITGSERVKVPVEVTDVKCDKCGAMMVIRFGRFGKFLACPSYPECKNIKNLSEAKPKVAVGKCPDCGKQVFERKSKKGMIFYGCEGYPDCKFASWAIPLEEKCPKCKKFLTKREAKKGVTIKCSNTECDYTRFEERKDEQ